MGFIQFFFFKYIFMNQVGTYINIQNIEYYTFIFNAQHYYANKQIGIDGNHDTYLCERAIFKKVL